MKRADGVVSRSRAAMARPQGPAPMMMTSCTWLMDWSSEVDMSVRIEFRVHQVAVRGKINCLNDLLVFMKYTNGRGIRRKQRGLIIEHLDGHEEELMLAVSSCP